MTAYLKKKKNEECEGLKISKKIVERKIRIFHFRKEEWRINYYFTDYFDIDTLFDLIQAELVEKVEG